MPVIVNCSYCGKEKSVRPYKARNNNRNFCNVECKNKWVKENRSGKQSPQWSRVKVNCTQCGRETEKTLSQAKKNKRHFCSKECQYEFKSNKVEIVCIQCSKKKMIVPSLVGERNFCTIRCHNDWMTLSITKQCAKCGKIIIVKPSNEKEQNFCSVECSRIMFIGENNPRWNPNLTDEARNKDRNGRQGYKEWRKAIYEADNYTCQCCGSIKSGTLNGHHILPYSEYKDLQTDLNNGITLCKICHKNFHDKFGYTKNTKEQLNEFLINYNTETPSQAS